MKKSRNWLALLTGILFIIGAFLIFLNPGANLVFLGWTFTFMVLVDGFAGIFDYFRRPRNQRSGLKLVLSILTVIIGISLLGDSALAQAALIPYLVGFWMICGAVARLMVGFSAPKGEKAWLIIGGIAMAIAAALVMANPLISGIAIVWMFAITLLTVGVIRIIEFFTNTARSV